MNDFPPYPPVPGANGNGHAAPDLPASEAAPDAAPAAPAGQQALETTLLGAGLISLEQLTEIVRARIESGRPTEQVVLERGLVAPAELERILGRSVVAPTSEAAPASAEAEPAPAVAAPEAAFEPAPTVAAAPAAVEVAPAVAPAAAAFEPAPIVAAPIPAAPEAAAAAPVVPVPVAEPVVQAAESVEVVPQPVEQPAPAQVEPAAPALSYQLLVHLGTGRTIEADVHASRAEAEAHAEALVGRIVSTAGGWIAVAGAHVRPEGVVAVELRPRLGDS